MKRSKLFVMVSLLVLFLSSVGFAQDENGALQVNINTATVEELATLPGVGEATANKIVEYREQNGKFKTVEELMNVRGIGEKRFEKLKSMISI
ncbi:MAG TPA: helix-hairpin-helix domain-containing protein [Thermodesulfobacteriota bacterium]|nr:helix-hairpin-helix domain-containing protein [Thermodesulfobacteriota bacterium]